MATPRPVRPTLLVSIFSDLPDPRKVGMIDHSLTTIVLIALLGALCGAEGWDEFHQFGEIRQLWLSDFLDLSAGIPSPDTFRRVFERIQPQAFCDALLTLVRHLAKNKPVGEDGKHIAIDGKTLRHSFHKAGGLGALHLVHAWSVQERLLLAQKATSQKSNEITAIPELLKMLVLEEATVTLDAMGCQREICQDILKQKGDYLIALKDNQPSLAADAKQAFEQVDANPKKAKNASKQSETSKGHGRVEGRHVTAIPVPPALQEEHEWPGLRSLVRVQSIRLIGQERSEEERYYVTSRIADATALGALIRNHWSVENQLHWMLDVALHEDSSRVVSRTGAENLACLRRTVLTLLRRFKGTKMGIKARQKMAGWSEQVLIDILTGGLPDEGGLHESKQFSL